MMQLIHWAMVGFSLLANVSIPIFSFSLASLFSNPLKNPQVEYGCTKGDCYNGYGIYVYSNGNKYIGDFSRGQAHGNGILYASSGSKYIGSWLHNDMEGKGRFQFAEGHEYLGQFLKNKFHGYGAMKYRNGDEYEGEWKFNFAEGKGKYLFHTGEWYEGSFVRGLFHGYGAMNYKNGVRFVGSWAENKRQGRGVLISPDGKAEQGEWSNGQLLAQNREYEEMPTVATPSPAFEYQLSSPKVEATSIVASQVKIWALVVGVAAYPHMPSLKYTDDDAYQFYAFLKSPEGGALPDAQIHLFIDETATRVNILKGLQNVLSKADSDDVVLFYYSGHGIDGAFIPVDFDGLNNRIYHEEIRRLLTRTSAKHKIVFGDACNSGSLPGMDSQPELLAARSAEGMLEKYYSAFNNTDGGTALLMSSKRLEVSLEDSGLRSGIFSYFLIKGLKGEADKDQNKIVTIGELSEYVRKQVSSYTAGAQTPVLLGQFDRNMPVGVIRH